MGDMGDHAARNVQHSAGKGGALRRAWFAAWFVTLVMGATTMAFQVYHSVHFGGMPWPLAWLYGIVPLLIAMAVLEIVAEWKAAPWPAKATAYVIMGGAMFLSASATGAVVLHAAPPRFSLLFGALLDAAELLAAYFIMNGPRAADAAAEARARAAEQAAAERARAEALDGYRRKLADVTARADAEVSALRATASGAQETAEAARSEAEGLALQVQELTRKLADARERNKAGTRGRKPAGSGTRKAGSAAGSGAPATAPGTAQATGDEDLVPPPGLTTEELVQWWVGHGKSASQAGVLAGVTDARGRQIMREVSRRSFRVLDGEEQTG